jgi:hypothetical protein
MVLNFWNAKPFKELGFKLIIKIAFMRFMAFEMLNQKITVIE